jgi:beta-glucosidase
VPQSRIDDAVARILRMMYLHGLFDTPPVIQALPVAENGARSRAIAEQAMVLLKNEGNALPLPSGITSIAVIGADADTIAAGGGSALIKPTYSVSPLEAIQARAGSGVTVQHIAGSEPVTSAALLPGPEPVPSDFLTPSSGQRNGLRAEYFLNPDFSGTTEFDRTEPYAAINGGFFIFDGLTAPSPHFPPQPAILNTNGSLRWTGTLRAPVTGTYQLSVTSTGTSRLFVDGNEVVFTTAIESGTTPTTNMAAVDFEADSVHDVRIEFVNDAPNATDSGPAFKFGWTPPAGAVRTSDWDGTVPAVLHARFGGQEQGNAIARILFGDVNPSGKLPITMPVDETKMPVSSPEQFSGSPNQNRHFSRASSSVIAVMSNSASCRTIRSAMGCHTPPLPTVTCAPRPLRLP